MDSFRDICQENVFSFVFLKIWLAWPNWCGNNNSKAGLVVCVEAIKGLKSFNYKQSILILIPLYELLDVYKMTLELFSPCQGWLAMRQTDLTIINLRINRIKCWNKAPPQYLLRCSVIILEEKYLLNHNCLAYLTGLWKYVICTFWPVTQLIS